MNLDRLPEALRQHLNTPLREGSKSSSQLAPGRQVRDERVRAPSQYLHVVERQRTRRTLNALSPGTQLWV